MINGTIRKCHGADYKQIAVIFHDAVHELASKDYDSRQLEAWAPHNYELDSWRKRCEEKQPYVFDSKGVIAGYIELDPDGHIDHTYVLPSFAGQGVMFKLMNHVKSVARDKCIKQLYSEVSITARPFFERQGFVYIYDNTVTVCDVAFLNFKMSYAL